VASLLTHINNTLRLVGEQPLLSSSGNLGDLCKQALDEALYVVAAEVRHTSFVQLTTFTVANTDYLQPAFTLPSRCVQVLALYYQTPNTTPTRLTKLKQAPLQTLLSSYSYSIVGSQVFVGNVLTRPFDLRLKSVVAPALPALDTDLLTLDSEVVPVLETVAASLLSSSYLDDSAVTGTLTRRAQDSVARLRNRAGLTRDGARSR
jgi:hypothetical protein